LLEQDGAEVPNEQLNTLINPLVEYGKLRAMGGSSFKLPVKLYFFQSIYKDYVMFVEKSGMNEALIIWDVIPNDKIKAVPLDSMAFANRRKFSKVGFSIHGIRDRN
jgi:hypothetical protein